MLKNFPSCLNKTHYSSLYPFYSKIRLSLKIRKLIQKLFTSKTHEHTRNSIKNSLFTKPWQMFYFQRVFSIKCFICMRQREGKNITEIFTNITFCLEFQLGLKREICLGRMSEWGIKMYVEGWKYLIENQKWRMANFEFHSLFCLFYEFESVLRMSSSA